MGTVIRFPVEKRAVRRHSHGPRRGGQSASIIIFPLPSRYAGAAKNTPTRASATGSRSGTASFVAALWGRPD